MDQLLNISSKGGKTIYDPVEFINKANIITLAVIGSFITFKLCDCLYANLYDPIVGMIVDSKISHQYYVKIGNHYVHLDSIFKEFIKWIIIVIFLMLVYNIFIKRNF
jgi:hypothetical protein